MASAQVRRKDGIKAEREWKSSSFRCCCEQRCPGFKKNWLKPANFPNRLVSPRASACRFPPCRRRSVGPWGWMGFSQQARHADFFLQILGWRSARIEEGLGAPLRRTAVCTLRLQWCDPDGRAQQVRVRRLDRFWSSLAVDRRRAFASRPSR